MAAGPVVQASGKKDGEAAQAGPAFVDVPWLTAPLLRNGVIQGYLFFEAKLQVASEGEADAVRVQLPKLRDAFLRELNKGKVVREDSKGVLDLERISEHLKDSANKVLGEEKVHHVVIVKAVRGAA
jgi:hypothetical protein